MAVITFKNVYLSHASSVVGKLEGEGPLGQMYDLIEKDAYFGKETWEQAESEMVRRTVNLLLSKAGLAEREVELMLGGDLLNQCTATGFAAMTLPSPYLGLYGACSTAAEALMTGGMFVESGFYTNAVAIASSHFCSSERQFRFPLEYGNQRPPVSQVTVTGTGAFLLRNAPAEIQLTKALPGRIREAGITDANNMGAAMANAAVDTILRFFNESGESPSDYDIISTGDLGREGFELANELLSKCGLDLCGKFTDCGMLIYDYNTQDVNSGGSGCGCSACVLATLFWNKLIKREVKKILLIGTGALLSPKTVLQKQPIPSIAHLVAIERV
ncbi:MAG: stage V sporulation protein AD [Clostridiales bacterium]|jgi:stage V sporulation protein AD|nr:stage V sporulation protein AD [Clostridiales bacterium]